MKRILHIVLVLVTVAACQGPRVIPKDTLTDIYVDMFLADQQVREEGLSHNQMDTLLVYEAVFNKYGYDTDDYQYSVRHYLRDPERFAKIFEEVTKVKMPCYLAVITKEIPPDIRIVQIEQERMDAEIAWLEQVLPRYEAIKSGAIDPERCEGCAWCRKSRVLMGPELLGDFDEDGGMKE